MKRTLSAIVVCAGLAFSGTSAVAADKDGEKSGKNDVAKACADLKKTDKAAFNATYGEHAMRTCKKGEKLNAVKTTPGEFKNASKACRAERDADPVAFALTHGTNTNGKNAFGKCVSSEVKDGEETPEEEIPVT
jgi:hypothetical protein